MDFKIIVIVLAVSIAAIVAGVLLPRGEHMQPQSLPWQIEHTADGATRVFGLTLGHSTLRDAEQQLQATAEVSLFDAANQSRAVEAYFDTVTLGGLSAKLVLVIDLSPEQLNALYERGTRIGTLGGERRKVTLHPQDLATVYHAPLGSITYLPRVRLDADLLTQRFGTPAQRIKEVDGTTVHWLYPQSGLDVALDEQGHAVLQYVAPERFASLVAPLMKSGMPSPDVVPAHAGTQ